MSLIKNSNCDNCIKKNVCKYKEVEVPEVISRVESIPVNSRPRWQHAGICR